MEWLLIDTNGWLSFLESDPEKDYFELLHHLISSGTITLLVPEILQQEWLDKSGKKLNKIRDDHEQSLANIPHRDNPLYLLLQAGYAKLEETAGRITELLTEGQQISLTDKVILEVGSRAVKKLAPFHNHGRNYQDGYLFFSATDWLKQQRIDALLFISNDSDFREDKGKRTLHPHFEDLGLTITFSQFVPGILGKWMKDHQKTKGSGRGADYTPFYLLSEKQAQLPYIEQLELIQQYAEKQQPFIPTGILARTPPFKAIEVQTEYAYDFSFGIHTNNDGLVKWLLELISKESNGQIDHEEKKRLDSIDDWLNRNSIFEIISGQGGVSIRSEDKTGPMDVERMVFRLDWYSALKELQQEEATDVYQWLQRGYYHAFFGQFTSAAKNFSRAFDYANENKLNILSYICAFNLKQLRHLSQSYFTAIPDEVQKIFDRVESKRLEVYKIQYSNGIVFDRDCIEHLHDRLFYTDAWEGIVEEVEKIRDQYHSQLKGGWSSNSFVKNLLAEWAKLESYLDRNRVVYKNYGVFGKLFDRFLEGMLLSYAIGNRAQSRLTAFDDYLLLRIIYYADPDRLISYVKRYDIAVLEYKPINHPDEQVAAIIIRFWKQLSALLKYLENKTEGHSHYFFQKLDNTIQNSLAILAITELGVEVYTQFETVILPLLSEEQVTKRIKPGFLALLLEKKGEHFSKEGLKAFFSIFLQSPRLHSLQLMNGIRSTVEKVGMIEMEKGDAEWIVAKFSSGEQQTDALLAAARVMKAADRERLQELLEQDLEKNFDQERCYYYCLYELIRVERFFKKYKSSFPPCLQPIDSKQTFGGSAIVYPEFSQLLNLCFKLGIDTTGPEFKQWKGFTPYYDWLMDMSAFDYSQFQLDWITQYSTKHYFGKIFGNEKVRVYVKNFMQRSNHPYLAFLYTKFSPL